MECILKGWYALTIGSRSSLLESLNLLCNNVQKADPEQNKSDDAFNCKKSMHTVLARIVMDGMLDYIAGLYIHELINEGDALTFGIFELFSLLKDQDDFLENLNILSKCKKRQSNAFSRSRDKHRRQEENEG